MLMTNQCAKQSTVAVYFTLHISQFSHTGYFIYFWSQTLTAEVESYGSKLMYLHVSPVSCTVVCCITVFCTMTDRIYDGSPVR
jgi:hypothetical protein